MLKNLAFTFVFILLSASVTLGQKRIFHAGLLGGISFAQVENDGLAHFSKLGFYGGGFISTDFTEIWEGEIGFTYVMKGSRENFSSNASFDGYVMTLGYIEFPFVAKVRANNWAFEFGLSFGLLVNSNESNIQQSDAFSSAPFQPFEFAGLVGVNYQFTEKVGLDLRGSYSIFPIRYPTDNVYSPTFYGQRNILLTLAVRYFIR
jgi:hypothetical protein